MLCFLCERKTLGVPLVSSTMLNLEVVLWVYLGVLHKTCRKMGECSKLVWDSGNKNWTRLDHKRHRACCVGPLMMISSIEPFDIV